jgi:pyruvate dehydrogenase E2 component (dihydrolipoamide acetyltransferase)
MATVVRMPEVLANSSEAVIQAWLVEVGQEIAIGDPLAEIETEKAVVEYAAEVDGILTRLIAEPGATIAVGDPIALVLAPGETDADIEPGLLGGAPATPEPQPVAAGEPVAATNGRRLFATPLVRKLASERGIDLVALTGTGPGGRIVRRDLDRLPAPTPTPAPAPAPEPPTAAEPVRAPVPVTQPPDQGTGFTDIPLTGMRRAIARRLTESVTTVPHFEVRADCRVDALVRLRTDLLEEAGARISLNDFVVKAVALALREVPEANAIFLGEAVRRFEGVDVAIAVALDDGLIAPVLRGVDRMPLAELAHASRDLADRARSGRLRPAELSGGAFSVSNLGMFGTTEFTAIIDPPRSGILAVGAAVPRPVVVDGELVAATVMTVTLSADHRVLDGAVAARWLAAFTALVEHPLRLLV